ncbi:MAG: YjbQ family protein [Acidiferrobacterales bacterium]
MHNDIEARGIPDESRNAHLHINAMLLGAGQMVPVVDGVPARGTWQSVLVMELDTGCA